MPRRDALPNQSEGEPRMAAPQDPQSACTAKVPDDARRSKSLTATPHACRMNNDSESTLGGSIDRPGGDEHDADPSAPRPRDSAGVPCGQPTRPQAQPGTGDGRISGKLHQIFAIQGDR